MLLDVQAPPWCPNDSIHRPKSYVLQLGDPYPEPKFWNLGKRLRIDFSHNGRLRACLKQISDWHYADRPLPKWRTAFLW